MPRHGKERHGIRECTTHPHGHGQFYICPSYSLEIVREIEETQVEFCNNLRNLQWRNQQIALGIPPDVLAAFDLFMGIR